MTDDVEGLKWTRRVGAGQFAYHTAETPLGRVRVSRINKHGVPGFRAYYPDGKHLTSSTPEEAMSAAEAYITALLTRAKP